MSFDPIRQEELRIMGYQAVIAEQGYERQMMGKVITVAAPYDTVDGHGWATVGDVLVEDEAGEIVVISANDWEVSGWVLIDLGRPEEPSTDPVELAQPVGLLQRDDSAEDEEAADAD